MEMEGLCHALGHASGRILRPVASGGVSGSGVHARDGKLYYFILSPGCGDFYYHHFYQF